MKLVMERDCPICLAYLNGRFFPAKHTTQRRITPDGKWHHNTKAGRVLHLLAECKAREK
jgi:hypothetical protein